MKKLFFSLAVLIGFAIVCCMPSCNVTRVITNTSEYFQKGDTSVVIQTKITETYDATKKN